MSQAENRRDVPPEVITGNPYRAYIKWSDASHADVRIVPSFTPTDEFLNALVTEGHEITHWVSTLGATVLALGGAASRQAAVEDVSGIIEALNAIENGTHEWQS